MTVCNVTFNLNRHDLTYLVSEAVSVVTFYFSSLVDQLFAICFVSVAVQRMQWCAYTC